MNLEKPNKYTISPDGAYVIGCTEKGVTFLFDTDDFEEVKKHTWYISKRGYATTNVKRRATPMHRVLLGNTKGFDVDHISRDRLDNRRRNLRICTHQQNSFNQPLRSTNSTGFIGVSFLKNANAFESYIHFNGKKHHLGLYQNPKEAAMARDRAALRLFGEYANLNFPEGHQGQLGGSLGQ